ncbi:MAG: lauroyl acyltransferase [Thermomonas haemolytica]
MRPMTELAAAVLYACAWGVARLPWPLLRALADTLAWLWQRLDAREARVARRNMELIRVDLDAKNREIMVRRILRTTLRQAMETLRLWTRPPARNLADIVEVHGETLFDAALRSGRGLIVAAPHLGNWELLNQWLAHKTPLAILYRPPESAVGEAFLRRVRARAGGQVEQVRAEPAGVRTLLKRLQKGGVVGILPDQQPKAGEGEFAPFFGKPALTMTLLSRLAHRSGAQVVLAWCRRLPGDGPPRFALHIVPAPDAVADADPQHAVAALNAALEEAIGADFTQYQWTYKRYTLRPPGSGEDNPYRDLY